MRNVSDAYKQAVYQKGEYSLYARHFLPYALFKIIDVDARANQSYVASSQAFYTDFAGLVDDTMLSDMTWGTLEPYQFLLSNNSVVCMDTNEAATKAALSPYGWSSEEMSDANGDCNILLQCNYPARTTTIGRTIVFDPCNDSVASDFDILYYVQGVLLKTVEIRNNTSYVVTSNESVTGYDRVEFHFLHTSKPYRRIRIIEDIPGVYAEYYDKDITSLSVSKSVDIFMTDLITGEMDLSIENVSQSLDILNGTGIEKYLMRRQPIDVYLNLVFPNDSTERVLVGSWRLATWKSDKGALEATFTIQDPTMQLAAHDYIKGTLPASYASLYDYAKDVLDDAGITKYSIDTALLNKYTTAPLPIATHKELLRLIAQAGQCVVLPKDNGSIVIKSISPLVYGSNMISQGSFEEVTDWTISGGTQSQDYIFFGTYSLKIASGSCSVAQTVATTVGRKYYVCCRVLTSQYLEDIGGSAHLNINGVAVTPNIANANIQVEKWTLFSAEFTADSSSTTVNYASNIPAACTYVDGFMLLDLTLLYGAGNEPSTAWCDANIRFFVTSMNLPRAQDPRPVDELDYSILIDAPEVQLDDPVDSVLTKIYSYSADTTTSECYKASRVIAGTEEFEIRFNSIVKSPTVTLETINAAGEVISDVTSTALVSITWYARAALIKVRANATIQIRVTGYKVNENSTDYTVNASLDPRLISDADSKTIDNKLITYAGIAEDVTSFAIYWYSRRYKYDFDWRQNPALELLDTVIVHDDFNNDNGVMLTDLDISYQNGVLSGSAKGRY